MSVFEALMLLCFGAAWPFSIARSWKSRSTAGKSPLFLAILLAGYEFGIIHKLLYSRNFVLVLYILNASMVSIDLGLWFRNKWAEGRIRKDGERDDRPGNDRLRKEAQ
jgi:hypothetical protein